MEWTEVKARLVMRSPILAISLMGGPNSSESNKLVQGKVFSLRQLQVKRLVLLNSSSKSKKSWIRGVAWMTFPQSAHRPRLSKPTGQSLRSTAPPPKQPLLQLTNSPHASPSLKATSGRLLNNSRFLALIIEIYLTCLHPQVTFTILQPLPYLPVCWEHIRTATLRLRPVCHAPSTTPSLFAPSPITLLCYPNAGLR